jgi:hypothetical protein
MWAAERGSAPLHRHRVHSVVATMLSAGIEGHGRKYGGGMEVIWLYRSGDSFPAVGRESSSDPKKTSCPPSFVLRAPFGHRISLRTAHARR